MEVERYLKAKRTKNMKKQFPFFYPPQGGLLEIPHPSEFYFKVFPPRIFKSFVNFRASDPRNITFSAILLPNPLDSFFVHSPHEIVSTVYDFPYKIIEKCF